MATSGMDQQLCGRLGSPSRKWTRHLAARASPCLCGFSFLHMRRWLPRYRGASPCLCSPDCGTPLFASGSADGIMASDLAHRCGAHAFCADMPLAQKCRVRNGRHPGKDFAPCQNLLDMLPLRARHTNLLMDYVHGVPPEQPSWTRTCHFVVTASPFLYIALASNPQVLCQVLAGMVSFCLLRFSMGTYDDVLVFED